MDCIFCENEGQLWMSPDVHYICETVSGFQVFDVRLNQVDWVKCSWFHGGGGGVVCPKWKGRIV